MSTAELLSALEKAFVTFEAAHFYEDPNSHCMTLLGSWKDRWLRHSPQQYAGLDPYCRYCDVVWPCIEAKGVLREAKVMEKA